MGVEDSRRGSGAPPLGFRGSFLQPHVESKLDLDNLQKKVSRQCKLPRPKFVLSRVR